MASCARLLGWSLLLVELSRVCVYAAPAETSAKLVEFEGYSTDWLVARCC